MKDLIEALQIFSKYMPDIEYPTHCEHDELNVVVDPQLVSNHDMNRLAVLSFHPTREGSFRSFRFGSA